jgi:hypothetical protein
MSSFASGLILTGCLYPLYAVLKGELFPGAGHVSLIGAWQYQLGRPGSGDVFAAGSGANTLVRAWLYYDPVLLVAGLAASVAALFVPRLRPTALASVLLVVVGMRPSGYLPAMYVIGFLPFFAISIAGTVEVVLSWLRERLRSGRTAWLQSAVAAAMVVGAVVVVGPRWYVGDRRAVTSDDNAGYQAAANYLRRSTGSTVVVDDVLWLDLVDAGYPRQDVLWFYKVDLDPAVAGQLRHGWRSVDYIVSTPAIRQDPHGLPTVVALLQHSTVERIFGSGDGRIEVRRVDKER